MTLYLGNKAKSGSFVVSSATSDATETTKGLIRIATDEEVKAGTDNESALTPKLFKDNLPTVDTSEFQKTDTAINYNNITNCITEIPQNIKYEISDNKLILKASSKLYAPNGLDDDGDPKFETKILEEDYTFDFTNSGASGASNLLYLEFTDASQKTDKWEIVKNDPTDNTYNRAWNITTNKMFMRTGTDTWVECINYLIGSCSVNRLRQVQGFYPFDSYGNINNLFFIFPGIKGIIPNGLDKNNNLINIFYESTKVYYKLAENLNAHSDYYIALGENGLDFINYEVYNYNRKYNYIMSHNNLSTKKTKIFYIGKFRNSNVDTYNIKTTVQLLDKNDECFISNQSMPSQFYISLTLATSGEYYTAPANGWFVVRVKSTAAAQELLIANTTGSSEFGMRIFSASSNQILMGYVPVSCRDRIKIIYSASSESELRFYYANGEYNVYSN